MRQILTSRLSLSKHLAHNLGNLLLLGKIGVFHNRRNASSRLLLLISKDRKSGSAGMPRPTSYAVFCLKKNSATANTAQSRPSAKGGAASVSHASIAASFVIFATIPLSLPSTLFPYTTLFRSTSRLSLSKHLAHNLGNLLLLGKIGVFHNRRNASSRLLLLISKHLILCIYLVFRILA